ncbi:MAG TPA: magnesium transporter CorA family protein [Polyangia bacterium]|nr:magnesium transporter CorA family protein [Polyangia bacterium]
MILTQPPGEPGAALWIDLREPTAEELARVRAATGLRVPTRSQVSEIESSSRLGFEGGSFYLSAPLVAATAEGDLAIEPVGFVLSPRVLVTVRFGALASFDAAHAQAAAAPPKSAAEALLLILELIVDRAADALEHTGGECDTLARAVFRGGGGRGKPAQKLGVSLRRIGDAAAEISRLRDELLGLGRIAGYLMESGIAGAPAPNAARLQAIRGDVASLTDYQSHLAGKVQFLLDATLGFINIEQNDIVKTLTIASVVGIPPVLVAGIYGMNFRVMPELHWTFGYPFALALIVVTGLLPLWWFKRRGWM